MTAAGRQLAALLTLRWQMLRGPGLRLSLVLTAAFLLWLLQLVVSSGGQLDAVTLATALELAPAAYLGFGALAIIAPLTSGGGNEVVPPDQLVAYPVRSATQFLGGLVLAPLNLVWVLQLLALAAMTSYLTLGTSLARGAVITAAYVGCITVLGQTAAWLIVGLRLTRGGRRVVGATSAGLVLTAVLTVRAGRSDEVLAASPTHDVVAAVIGDSTTRWAVTAGVLLTLVVAGLLVGARVCAWALARPGDAGSARHLAPVRRRSARRGRLRELIAVDRASVWRAPALRRGGLVLTVLPGLLAAGAAVPWESLIVLPGLVAAGAGLLFGINAFCLDGPGALWLSSLPHDARLAARAKVVVLSETVLAAVTIAAVAGSLRSPGSPTAAELAAIVAAGLACTAVVVAQGMRTSVKRPHSASLRGPRDAVAPPGALALGSVRLALPTALVGLLIASAATVGVWWLPLAFAVPVLLLAALSLNRTVQSYSQPVVRARVTSVVAAG